MIAAGVENLRQGSGRPLRKWLRRLLLAVSGALVLLSIFQIVGPFLVSTIMVRESMERAVQQWTGHQVTIEGTPEITFWPEARITLRDVTVRKPGGDGGRMLAKVSTLSASFELAEALSGQPEFEDFRLTDAEFHVLRAPDGKLDWAGEGLLTRAVREARADGSGQIMPPEYDAPISRVGIVNGTLEVLDTASGRTLRFSAINGAVDWPWLSDGVKLTAEADFNGRRFSADLATMQPLLLLAGKSSSVSGALKSELISGRFDGIANLATHAFLSGDVELTSHHLTEALEWAGLSIDVPERFAQLSLDAHVVSNEDFVRFESLNLRVGDTSATGILDLVLSENGPPRLAGTLALDEADLASMVSVITAPDEQDGTSAAGVAADMELDIRLSARRASLGRVSLTDVAVSVTRSADHSRLDIADSVFANGRLTGRVATSRSDGTGGIALRASLQNVDFGGLIHEFGLPGPLPRAHGSIELSLEMKGPLTVASWREGVGSIHLRAGPGSLRGGGLDSLRALAAEKPYFPLSQAGDDDLEFDSIDVVAALDGGFAEIREGTIVSGTETVKLSGVVPYAATGLALSASVEATRPNAETAPFILFIGGSWPDPIIWPVTRTQAQPAE